MDISVLWIILIMVTVLVVISIRQVNQYERGVKFTFGRFSGVMEPVEALKALEGFIKK